MKRNSSRELFVSVIVITKNNASTIEKCVESLINQTYPKDRYEILFVDGHSSDHTDDIIKKYSEVSLPTVKLVYENLGTMGYARNVGIEHSKGEVVAFTDGDAYPTKNWLESIVKVFSENDGQIVVGGMDILIPTIKTRDSISSWRRRKFQRGISAISRIRTVNVAMSRDVLLRSGGFDQTLSHFDEAELLARLYFKEKIREISFYPEIVVFHERRKSSMSARMRKLFAKSVMSVPVLFRRHVLSLAFSSPSSAVATSLFFVFAALVSIPAIIFLTFFLQFWQSLLSLLVVWLVGSFLYSLKLMRSTQNFSFMIFLTLSIDALVRVTGAFCGFFRWISVELYKKLTRLFSRPRSALPGKVAKN